MCLIEMGMPKMGPDRTPELGQDGKPVINWMPRPQISCAQDVVEGMGVRTNSPLAEECRRGVMEFLLINHPLDCPICDQAGECRLQEFSVEYGRPDSRFLEHKVKKPKRVEIGPRVMLDDERCILCSRCIRFCQEIAQDDVLGFADRGSHTILAIQPGKRLENNYSLNTVDICPVGALTSSHFRFEMRVWFLKETKSVCTSCATGCNMIIGSREDVIYRQTPRENTAVNSVWMCDYGRLNFEYLTSTDRLLEPAIFAGNKLQAADWKKAIEYAALQLKHFSGWDIAIVASARMTNEELWLTSQLARQLNVSLIDVVPRHDSGDHILLSQDRNPNINGAKIILGLTAEPGARLKQIADGVAGGRIKALVALGEDPTEIGITVDQLKQLPSFIMTGILHNAATPHTTALFPSAGYAEKRGSMINGRGRLQRLNRAVRPPGDARDDWEILRDLNQAITGSNGIYTIEDVCRQMADSIPQLNGLSLGKIGDLGLKLIATPEGTTTPLPPGEPADEEVFERETGRGPK
jgi:NADH-quinone oxidoreductase subunit G